MIPRSSRKGRPNCTSHRAAAGYAGEVRGEATAQRAILCGQLRRRILKANSPTR